MTQFLLGMFVGEIRSIIVLVCCATAILTMAGAIAVAGWEICTDRLFSDRSIFATCIVGMFVPTLLFGLAVVVAPS